MNKGTRLEGKVRTRTCKACGCLIGDTFGCSYECPYDFMLPRPKGSVLVRVWERVDTLLSEEEE